MERLADIFPYILTKENFSTLLPDLSLYPNGIVIPIDKPYQFTSTECVGKVKFFLRNFFRSKNLKVGHAGTLDPLATGLLLICVGKATKLADYFQSHSKEYITQFVFGATTPSYDREKPISQLFEYKHITEEGVERAIEKMIGIQEQVPPIFSAKLVNGKRLYEFAREGETIEIRSSTIEIYDIEILRDYSHPNLTIPPFETADGQENFVIKKRGKMREDGEELSIISPSEISSLSKITLRIECSKGTYIRSIARDLGISLCSGAFMNGLCRTRSGDFTLSEALPLNYFLKDFTK